MKSKLSLFLLLILPLACTKPKSDFRLSQEEFKAALMDIELAREASRTASVTVQDSFLDSYLEAIAIRYNMSSEDLQNEMKLQLSQSEDLDDFYDDFRIIIDSITRAPGEHEK